MKALIPTEHGQRLARVGRDGKNRYCIYYFNFEWGSTLLKRNVVVGGLTKRAAYKLLGVLGEVK